MFGKRLRELRKSNEYSMDRLVDIYNKRFNGRLNKSTISRYENGLQEPIFTVVKNFSILFNVTTDYLTGEDTFKEAPSSNNWNLSKIEKQLILDFRKMSDQGKEYILQTMNMAKDTYKKDNCVAHSEKNIS